MSNQISNQEKLYYSGSSDVYSKVLSFLEKELGGFSNEALVEWLDEGYIACAGAATDFQLKTDPYIWGQLDSWNKMHQSLRSLDESMDGVEFLRKLAIAKIEYNEKEIGQ